MFQNAEAKTLLGDCLEVLRQMDAANIHLAYLDPPFFTQKTHSLRTRDRQREFSFADLWASHSDYAEFLYCRLKEVHRVLSASGVVFFHCDRNASHIARAVLDETFGADQFRSEIIWHYRRWSNSQRTLLPAHQTIYFYSKSDEYTFNTIYGEYSPSTNVDQILQRRKRDEFGKSVYERDDTGQVIANGGKKGVPLSDVWDIPYLNPKAKERTGYPTQKPLLLLERIIELATSPGDKVLDPFCGSGTTLVAARMLGRNAVGIDISQDALAVAQQRLTDPQRTDSNLLNEGRESYRQADERALVWLEGLEFAPVHRNKGIDAILKDDIHGRPILVRVQREHETVAEAARMLSRAAKDKGAAILFVIKTREDESFLFNADLPFGLEVIECPALAVTARIATLKAKPPDQVSRLSGVGHQVMEAL